MKALPALVVDIVAVTVFAILGRSSHAEANTLLGVLGTAWPFLVGAAIGHLLCRGARDLRGDPTGWRPGLVVWASTLLIGMVLRVLSGDTAAWSFIIVATIVLAVFLLGWRTVVRLVHRARTRTTTPV
ncbi:MAG TPA: DUF3054 domain-containing protein [Microlunatus sp.]